MSAWFMKSVRTSKSNFVQLHYLLSSRRKKANNWKHFQIWCIRILHKDILHLQYYEEDFFPSPPKISHDDLAARKRERRGALQLKRKGFSVRRRIENHRIFAKASGRGDSFCVSLLDKVIFIEKRITKQRFAIAICFLNRGNRSEKEQKCSSR